MVTSIVSFVPDFISQMIIIAEWRKNFCSTIRPPRMVRKLWQYFSVDRPLETLVKSSRMLSRQQFSLRFAWLGQHFLDAGYFGGAVLSEGSIFRQSPRRGHGGDKHVSFSAGTQTSLSLHSCAETLPSAMQFGSPHQRFEHLVSLCSPHRQELHRLASPTSSVEKEHFGGEFESTTLIWRAMRKNNKAKQGNGENNAW